MSDALQRLREGNARFLEGRSQVDWAELAGTRTRTADGQAPFAVVLTCADSRVPPEMIFDQGIGDLFVIRVAGNIVTPPVIGSVEFAVTALGSDLVVSMGHTRCGAVGAAVDQKLAASNDLSDALQAIVDGITPAVEAAVDAMETPGGAVGTAAGDPGPDTGARDAIVAAAVREHARRSARALVDRSPVLTDHARRDALTVVPAEYDLATGRVTFL